MDYVFNPEGYTRYYGQEEHYRFYYIKDYLGNVREVYVNPEPGYKECVQRTQYYPAASHWLSNQTDFNVILKIAILRSKNETTLLMRKK